MNETKTLAWYTTRSRVCSTSSFHEKYVEMGLSVEGRPGQGMPINAVGLFMTLHGIYQNMVRVDFPSWSPNTWFEIRGWMLGLWTLLIEGERHFVSAVILLVKANEVI